MPDSYLIISYAYAPQLNAQVYRWQAIAEYWATQGHHVTVISACEGSPDAHEVLNGVEVWRVENRLALFVRRLDMSLREQAAAKRARGGRRRRTLGRIASSIAYRIYRRLYWPDPGFHWYAPAVRMVRRCLTQRDYDYIISSTPLFTANLVGRRAHALSQSAVWLVDYGDPFSLARYEPPNNVALYNRLNRHIEGRILGHADVISLTTTQLRDIYQSAFPHIADRLRVIPVLLSLAAAPAPTSTHNDGHIRLVYAGKLYANIRPPDFLFRLVDALDERVELHLYGDTGDVRAALKRFAHLRERGRLILHGNVSREEVAEAMAAADVLVNIGNRTEIQLPSKVVEYASTGKPILNLSQIAGDSSAEVYASYPAALILLEGERAFEEQVTILRRWLDDLPPPVDSDVLARWLVPYQLDSVAAAYESALAGT